MLENLRVWIPIVVPTATLLIVAYQMLMLRKSILGATYQRLYELMINIDKFFIENEELKPYFYPNAEGDKESEGNQKPSRDKLMSTAEMMVDYFDTVYHQRNVMPRKTFDGFTEFMREVYGYSDEVKTFVAKREPWYPPKFVGHLKGS